MAGRCLAKKPKPLNGKPRKPRRIRKKPDLAHEAKLVAWRKAQPTCSCGRGPALYENRRPIFDGIEPPDSEPGDPPWTCLDCSIESWLAKREVLGAAKPRRPKKRLIRKRRD